MYEKEDVMTKKKKLTNVKGKISVIIILGLLSWMPLKAEQNSHGKAQIPKKVSVLTVITNQIPTPIEKTSLDTLTLYESSENHKNYDFSVKPFIPEFKSEKSLETYKYIQNQKKIHPFEESLFEASLITNLALNAADYFTTRKALKYEGLQEGNPFMKPFVKNDMSFAAVKITLTMSNYLIMKKLYKKNKTLGWVVSMVSNLVLSYVVSSNIAHIHKSRIR